MSCENKTCQAAQIAATAGAAAPPVLVSRLPWAVNPDAILDYDRQSYIAMRIADEGLPMDESPDAFMERLGQEYAAAVLEAVKKKNDIPDFDWLAERVGEHAAALEITSRLILKAHEIRRDEYLARIIRPAGVVGGKGSSPEELAQKHAELVEWHLSSENLWDRVPVEVVADYPELAKKYDILIGPPEPPFPAGCDNLNTAYVDNAKRYMEQRSKYSPREKGQPARDRALFCTLNEVVYIPFGSVEAADEFLQKNAGKSGPLLTTVRQKAITAAELRQAIAAARKWENEHLKAPQVNFDHSPTSVEIKNACEQLGGGEFIFKYREPTLVLVNSRKREIKTELRARIFTSTDGFLCYMPPGRKATGFSLGHMNYENLESIIKVDESRADYERVLADSRRLASLMRSIHPNAWNDPGIRKKYMEYPEEFVEKHGCKTANMRSIFPRIVIKDLQHAFETGRDYLYSLPTSKGIISVEVKRMDDGTVQAWYTNKIAGRGTNHHILINPTTALFIGFEY